ncbi:MAG: hypothetical protein HQL17_03715, partial [Candidatus Omnitrophica bacterium]|nr:hypothetical protein [Candidatus Omnitrophota bacterium]
MWRKSFTIIENLVAISVVAIIIGFVLPEIKLTQEKTKMALAQSDLSALKTAIESYYDNSNPSAYPPATPTISASYLVPATPRIIGNVLYDPFGATATTEYTYILSTNKQYFAVCSVGPDKVSSVSAVTDGGKVVSSGDDICVTSGTLLAAAVAEPGVAPAKPSTPTVGSATGTSLIVTWSPAPGATSYTVTRATNSNMITGATSLGAQVSGLTDSGLLSATQYWYTVVAVNGYGSSSPSDPGTGSTPGLSPPGAPSVGSPTSSTLQITWSSVAGASSYTLSRATNSAMTGSVDLVGKTSPYTDTALLSNTQYWYTVKALSIYGPSAASLTGNATTTSGVPAAPAAPTLGNATATSLDVTWSTVSGATSYTVSRATNSIMTSNLTALGTKAIGFTDSPLSSGTQYWYTVIAVNGAGNSTASSTGNGWTLPATPGAPTISSATATSVAVSWSGASGAATYTVSRATNSIMTSNLTALGTKTSGFTDSPLSSGTQYWYTVTAVNSNGNASAAASSTGNGWTLPATPSAPTVGTPTATSLAVSWSGASGAATYTVARATNSIMTSNLTALGTQISGFTDSPLSSSTQYWYTVTAVNSNGDASAAASSTGTGTTSAGGPDITTGLKGWWKLDEGSGS